MKDISYKFYASPDGRKVAARIKKLRRHILLLSIGIFFTVVVGAVAFGRLLFNFSNIGG